MALGLGNNLIRSGGAGNADKLSLDLQFATDKTLTARKGPTPTFIRASGDNGGTTYFGPSGINVAFSFDGNDYDEAVFQNTVFNGRFRWTSGDISFGYTGTAWALSYDGNNVATSAPTSAFRPDGANWSGTAAVVTATGAFGIVKAANNEPRFDHDPVTLACKGLLIEEQRVNSQRNSGDFSLWTNGIGTTTTTNQTTSPDGTFAADVFAETIANTQHFISDTLNVSVTSGTAYTLSVFAKKGIGSTAPDLVQITGSGGAFGTTQYATFNIQSGSVNSSAGGVATIQSFGNGWYRLSFTVSATATTTTALLISFVGLAPTSRLPSYIGLATSDMYLWGAQLEAGSFPTSYIPTTTGPVTRSADTCSITGSAFSNLWNTSGGTFLFEGFLIPSASPAATINQRMLSSGSNRRWLYGNQPGVGTIAETVTLFDGASTPNYFTNVRIATRFKMAISVEALNCKASFNGSAISTVSHNGTLLNSVTFLALFETASGFITGVKYYRKNLPNAKLQQITT